MVFTATVGDRYLAVGVAKEEPGKVALVVRDLTTDPKGEHQTRLLLTPEQLSSLSLISDALLDRVDVVESDDDPDAPMVH